ncbi:hypothetical protein [Natronorubrum texcoconense]|uniref:Cohesin domain-containing protein n=1 Tax=Natronorubrum texcoconense TaxID=1095776 RepID=A0A1G8YLF9_9EURY|nr:hypothetical protein SAMN04515672_2191 [Natronorubrum texcoconense]
MIPNPTRRSTVTSRSVAVGAGIVLVATALAFLVVATLGLAAGTAVAGDQSAVLRPSPYAIDADPGEEFTVEITMQSQGGHGGEGVESVALVAQYHPDYLEITDIERGPWLEQGTETDVEAERVLAHDEGTAVLEQWRNPVEGGATGNAELATITVEVADDAPPSEATISVGESRVEVLRQMPLPIFDQDATVTIDGGGEAAPAFDHPDPHDLETDAVDDGEGEDASGANSTTADEGDETDGGDAVSGLSAPATAVIVVGTVLAFVGRRSVGNV